MDGSQNPESQVMFLGEYDHVLDPQGRITIPRDWRRPDGGESDFVLFPARDAALLLFPAAVFLDFVARARKLAIADAKLQLAFAALGSRARRCKCDKQGRLALERRMLEGIGVTGKLKLLGAMTHIRICAAENWLPPEGAALDSCLDEIQKLSGVEPELAALLAESLRK